MQSAWNQTISVHKCFGLIMKTIIGVFLVVAGLFYWTKHSASLNNPNFHLGTDSERIEAALTYAKRNNLPLEITAREPDAAADRDYWLIDRAILMPGDFELRLIDCKIKLSDSSRDNFIRSANCGRDVGTIPPLSNIRIIGSGKAVLEGAARPRATGDSGKNLGVQTFGTDVGKWEESQRGDWRNIGILLAEVTGFTLENLTLVDSHCWAISLEYCRTGKINNIHFQSTGKKTVDGRTETILNQDGLDLRRGCRSIDIDGIYGHTGDDLVALTAIPDRTNATSRAGELGKIMVSALAQPSARDAVEDITIRNVKGFCAGEHHIVRFLNTWGIKMRRIHLENLEDLSPEGIHASAAIKIGDSNPRWGGVTPLGDTTEFTIKNVRSRAKSAVKIAGSLSDSTISGVTNLNPKGKLFIFESGHDNVRNVVVN